MPTLKIGRAAVCGNAALVVWKAVMNETLSPSFLFFQANA
jgi:hypothetical protein